MSLPEAIVYLLASAGYGMKTDQIAREINERRLYVRRDGQPVSDKQVYLGWTTISDNGGKTPTVSHILDHHRHLGRHSGGFFAIFVVGR